MSEKALWAGDLVTIPTKCSGGLEEPCTDAPKFLHFATLATEEEFDAGQGEDVLLALCPRHAEPMIVHMAQHEHGEYNDDGTMPEVDIEEVRRIVEGK